MLIGTVLELTCDYFLHLEQFQKHSDQLRAGVALVSGQVPLVDTGETL